MAVERSSATIEVELFGELARRLGATTAAPLRRHVPVSAAGARIADVLAALGIPPDEIGHLFLNAQYSTPTRPVRPGDRLGVFGRDMALIYRQYFRPVADERA
jgi:hypothetical protein